MKINEVVNLRLYNLAIALVISIGFEGCSINTRQESNPQTTDVQPVISSQLPPDELTTRKQKQWNPVIEKIVSSPKVKNSKPVPVEPVFVQESETKDCVSLNGSQLHSANSPELFKQGSFMTLTPTQKLNDLSNPLYHLTLYADGHCWIYEAVSGRAKTQNRDRNKAGTQAPLPNGQYRVAESTVPGTDPEVGKHFLPLQPLFQTGRSAMGIHYDPSFQKKNGEDGTEGCIALTKKQELEELLNKVHKYQLKYIEVKIQ